MSTRTKTYAKAMGLKTVIESEDRRLNFIFEGKQNPFLESQFRQEEETYHKSPPNFLLRHEDNQTYHIEKSQSKMSANVSPLSPPDETNLRDPLGINTKLKERYLANPSTKDTLHIQIIHNLEDIKKILSLYVNDVYFTLANLMRKEDVTQNEEPFSSIPFATPYHQYGLGDKKNQKNKEAYLTNLGMIRPHLKMFQIDFRLPDPNKNNKTPAPYDDEKYFNMFRILSLLRNACQHGSHFNLSTLFSSSSQTKDLEEFVQSEYEQYRDSFWKSFAETSKVALLILERLYPEKTTAQLSEDYFELTLNHSYKYLGLSLKPLREGFFIFYQELVQKNQAWQEHENEVKKRFHTLANYVLQDYLLSSNRQDFFNQWQLKVRASLNADQKAAVYADLLSELIHDEALNQRLQKLFDLSVEYSGKKSNLPSPKESSFKPQFRKLSLFARYLFFLCKFLGNKETHLLLDSIGNKISNIGSLVSLYQDTPIHGITNHFHSKYSFLDVTTLNKIEKDLQIVRALLNKRKGKDTRESDILIKEACALFHSKLSDEEIKELLKEETKKQKDSQQGSAYVKAKKPIRNYIRNNVIESRFFHYLVRYGNPYQLRGLNTKHSLLSFALNQLPEEELKQETYFVAPYTRSVDQVKSLLLQSMKDLTLERIFDCVLNRNGAFENRLNGIRYDLVGLLFIKLAYLILKNTVQINTLYFIAFSFYERDYILLTGISPFGNDKSVDHLRLTELYCQHASKIQDQLHQDTANGAPRGHRVHINKRVSRLNTSMSFFKEYPFKTKGIFHKYRNVVAHINLVAYLIDLPNTTSSYASYFSIYQHLLQHFLVNKTDSNDSSVLQELKSNLDHYQTFSKNFLRQINVPFAYNTARYNILANEKFFLNKVTLYLHYEEPRHEIVEIDAPLEQEYELPKTKIVGDNSFPIQWTNAKGIKVKNPYPVSKHAHLYAKLESPKVSIQLSLNGGSGTDLIHVEIGQIANIPTPTKANYELAFWSKDIKGNLRWNPQLPVQEKQTFTLYAQWKKSKKPFKQNKSSR